MAKRKDPFSRIRLVYRRSSTLLKCMVLATLVLCTVALVSLSVALHRTRQQTEDLRSQAIGLQEENRQLQEDIDQADTVDGVKKIASEELELVDPDAEFFRPEGE